MSEIKLTIDGREVAVPQGWTLLQAANKLGVHIPTLCHLWELNPCSACRVCLVEVEGARNLATACSYPAAAGMKVHTRTERVLKARRLVMELILSDHPLDCMTCEKTGSCHLQDLAYELGLTGSRMKGEQHRYPVDQENPFIVRDYNKCVLCERCTRICDEVQGSMAIEYAHRGFHTKVGVPYHRSLTESDCVFCGQCVSVCPVGALTERSRVGRGREWEFRKVKTICSYCGVGCLLVLNVKDGEIVRVTSDRSSGVNRGNMCVKGRFGFDYVHSPDRLTEPLIREGGTLRPASWDEALGRAAKALKDIKNQYGPDSIGFLVSAKCTNEENYALQKLARAALGTNNVDHCARL
jgi:predicted molibdopterin-dependent oxidoreductase YjgC